MVQSEPEGQCLRRDGYRYVAVSLTNYKDEMKGRV